MVLFLLANGVNWSLYVATLNTHTFNWQLPAESLCLQNSSACRIPLPAESLCLQNPSACRIPLPTESLAEIKVSLRPENHLSNFDLSKL